MTILEDLH